MTIGDRRRTPVVPNLVGNFEWRRDQCVSGSKEQGNRCEADVLAHDATLYYARPDFNVRRRILNEEDRSCNPDGVGLLRALRAGAPAGTATRRSRLCGE